MYQFSYADVQEDGVAEAREREREAITHSINLLRLAMKKGRQTREAIDAIHFTAVSGFASSKIWPRPKMSCRTN